jgi:hypothetical protein
MLNAPMSANAPSTTAASRAGGAAGRGGAPARYCAISMRSKTVTVTSIMPTSSGVG